MPINKCYTFKQNLKDWIMIYKVGQRIMLNDKDYEERKEYLVPTSQYTWLPFKKEKSGGCGCK